MAGEPLAFSAPGITVQESVKIVCPRIGLDTSVSEAVVQLSPLVPVTVQLPTLLTLHEILVVSPEETRVGWTEKFVTLGAGGA